MASAALSQALYSLGGHASAPLATDAPACVRSALLPLCLRFPALVATHLRTVATGVSHASATLAAAGKDARPAAAARLLALLKVATGAWPAAAQHAACTLPATGGSAAGLAHGACEVLRAAQEALLTAKQPLWSIPDVVAAAVRVGELLRGCLEHAEGRELLQARPRVCVQDRLAMYKDVS